MVIKLEYEEIKSEVPTGWSLDYLENLCATSSGTTPPRSAAERYYRNGTIHWVKTTDLTNSNISFTEELITKIALDETSLRVYPVGTVLVAMYGGFNQIGRTGLLRVPAAVNQAITAIQPDPKLLVSEYLINVLNYRVSYWKTVASSSRKDPNITSNDIKKLPIIFPDIREQRAIATALSDVEALIRSLNRLIAKKRDIKQATMQQLLTGKTRLLGFCKELKSVYKQTEVGEIPEDWSVKRLEELGSWKGGATPSMANTCFWINGTIYWASSGDIKTRILSKTASMITEIAVKQSSAALLQEGAILIVTRSGILRKYLPVAKNTIPIAINQDIKALIPNSQVSTDYLLQVLSERGPNILSNCMKSGTTVESVEYTWLKKYRIPLPAPSEQQAISTILSDMDAEITALEQKRDKTHALKQGMMQELLTGKTRLV